MDFEITQPDILTSYFVVRKNILRILCIFQGNAEFDVVNVTVLYDRISEEGELENGTARPMVRDKFHCNKTLTRLHIVTFNFAETVKIIACSDGLVDGEHLVNPSETRSKIRILSENIFFILGSQRSNKKFQVSQKEVTKNFSIKIS